MNARPQELVDRAARQGGRRHMESASFVTDDTMQALAGILNVARVHASP